MPLSVVAEARDAKPIDIISTDACPVIDDRRRYCLFLPRAKWKRVDCHRKFMDSYSDWQLPPPVQSTICPYCHCPCHYTLSVQTLDASADSAWPMCWLYYTTLPWQRILADVIVVIIIIIAIIIVVMVDVVVATGRRSWRDNYYYYTRESSRVE